MYDDFMPSHSTFFSPKFKFWLHIVTQGFFNTSDRDYFNDVISNSDKGRKFQDVI